MSNGMRVVGRRGRWGDASVVVHAFLNGGWWEGGLVGTDQGTCLNAVLYCLWICLG